MNSLHIVQGGIDNGDQAWLERAAKEKLDAPSWITPKAVQPGDDVVIYVVGYGFYATATIKTFSKPRTDWPNRYGAALTAINLLEPAISLGTILKKIPELTWAKYPRSITTPTLEIANEIKKLVQRRLKKDARDLVDSGLSNLNLGDLRKLAILKSRPSAPLKEQKIHYRIRTEAIRLYVLGRAKGICEGCKMPAPFQGKSGPYLEPHHTLRLADDGPDHPKHVIALCPNCHRKTHYSTDAKAFNMKLIKTLKILEG